MSYNVRFPLEKLNELASTVTNLLTQVSTLTAAVTVLSQHITQLESEPGYTLPPNATFTQLTCSDLYYLDENGNIQDLEQELVTLKSIDTSHSDAAAQSAQNAFSSAGDAKPYASTASTSSTSAATSANAAAISAVLEMLRVMLVVLVAVLLQPI